MAAAGREEVAAGREEVKACREEMETGGGDREVGVWSGWANWVDGEETTGFRTSGV